MVTHLYSDTSICTSSLSLSCLILGSGSPSPCLVATLLPVPELPSVRASCLRWLKLTNEKSVFGSLDRQGVNQLKSRIQKTC